MTIKKACSSFVHAFECDDRRSSDEAVFIGAGMLGNEIMQRLNCGRIPTIAQSLGLGENFRFWRGASGRRYLFSLVRESDIDDLQNVILIEATMSGLEPVPVWLGEVDHDGERLGEAIGVATSPRRRRYVHFLEGSADDRRAALNDLFAASMERTAA